MQSGDSAAGNAHSLTTWAELEFLDGTYYTRSQATSVIRRSFCMKIGQTLIKGFILLTAIGLLFSISETAPAAAQWSRDGWLAGEELEVESDLSVEDNRCHPEEEHYVDVGGVPYKDRYLCIVRGSKIDLTTIIKPHYVGTVEGGFYYLNTDQLSTRLIRGTDTAIYAPYSFRGIGLKVVNNFSERLTPIFQEDRMSSYGVNWQNPTYPSDGRSIVVESYGTSSDGRYFVYTEKLSDLSRVRYVYVDLITGNDRVVDEGLLSEMPNVLAVSDNGEYIVGLSGGTYGGSIKTWDVSDCGESLTDFPVAGDMCPYKEFSFNSAQDAGCSSISMKVSQPVQFSVNTLEFGYTCRKGDIYGGRKAIVHPSGFSSHRLEYLALGDSYSSGEGDVVRDGYFEGNYYVSGTESKGECHLSSRSYPFLLGSYYEMPVDKIRSVACSGAVLKSDYTAALASYLGQNGRLKGLSQERRRVVQGLAIDTFTPGSVPQIEFVKRYRPKVLTLTGGGNDVGFADVLRYCALPAARPVSKLGPAPHVDVRPSTCPYADETTEQSDTLNASIDGQYERKSSVIKELRRVSPDTRIIIVGYPKFLGENTTCLNAASLSVTEREAINRFVSRLNNVLRRVAQDHDISYVDVQDSLAGGRICEGSEYMVGLAGIVPSLLLGRGLQQVFHPNHLGHEKMADAIVLSGAMKQDRIPEGVPLPSQRKGVTQQQAMMGDSFVRGATEEVIAPAGQFKAGSVVSGRVYSDEIDLGEFIAGADGSINATVDTANFPPGLHVLVLKGIDSTGDPVTLYQFITVRYSESDEDGDGIADNNDPCPFIEEWFDEASGRNVCARLAYSANDSSDTFDKGSPLTGRALSVRDGSRDETIALIEPAFGVGSIEQLGYIPSTLDAPAVKSRTAAVNNSAFLWFFAIVGVAIGGWVLCKKIKKQR